MDDNAYDIEQKTPETASKIDAADIRGLEQKDNTYCGPCLNDAGGPAYVNSKDAPAQNFLELIYGVIFEPVKTMKRAAHNPPLVFALLLVTILGLAGVLMWLVSITKALNQTADISTMGNFMPSARPLMVLAAVAIFLWGYIKWFSYSAFISLAAEMLGGEGKGRNVAAIVGLSLIPTILIIPAQMLNFYLASASFVFITVMIVWIWVTALMVIGVREVHGLSTGRTLLAVLSPVLVLGVFAGLILAGLVAVAVSIYTGMKMPDYF